QSITLALTSSTRKLPGPWYSQFTNLVLKYHTLRGRRMHYIHALHQRYGPAVRTAPFEADFTDLESFREIHRIAGGFVKSQWYQRTFDRPALDIFTIINPKDHAARRRLMAQPFSYSSLRANWEPLIRERTLFTVSRIKEEAEHGKTDIFKWWTLMAHDIVTRLAFGENPLLVESGKKSTDIEDLELTLFLTGLRTELQLLLDIFLSLPFAPIRKLKQISERVLTKGWKAVENAKEGKHNVFSQILDKSGKSGDILRDVDACAEAQGLVFAGSGTTAVTQTYLIWAALQRPDLARSLAEECSHLNSNFSDAELEKLPILNAVINETLRLYGAAPGSLLRVVPKQGATLSGYFISGGSTVSTQAFSIHRNPDMFPDPEHFDHTRWLPGSSSSNLEAGNAAFHPFGAGSRTCIGMHLARIELRYATAFFFRECPEAYLAPSTTPESMQMVNYFLIYPAKQRCEVSMLS
ncbi:cytochrome P450 monooxygenase, partial [Xylogone sp. PMI_703]